MKYLLKNWEEFLDKNVVVNGWVRLKRKFRGVKFLSINDGTCNESLQAVITQENKASARRQRINRSTKLQ